jgi:hypothetical protein
MYALLDLYIMVCESKNLIIWEICEETEDSRTL